MLENKLYPFILLLYRNKKVDGSTIHIGLNCPFFTSSEATIASKARDEAADDGHLALLIIVIKGGHCALAQGKNLLKHAGVPAAFQLPIMP
jgi:hypothetical protein